MSWSLKQKVTLLFSSMTLRLWFKTSSQDWQIIIFFTNLSTSCHFSSSKSPAAGSITDPGSRIGTLQRTCASAWWPPLPHSWYCPGSLCLHHCRLHPLLSLEDMGQTEWVSLTVEVFTAIKSILPLHVCNSPTVLISEQTSDLCFPAVAAPVSSCQYTMVPLQGLALVGHCPLDGHITASHGAYPANGECNTDGKPHTATPHTACQDCSR